MKVIKEELMKVIDGGYQKVFGSVTEPPSLKKKLNSLMRRFEKPVNMIPAGSS